MKRGETVLLRSPRAAILRTILLNHWYHHRGQLTVYLRLLDVPLPSVYGATADEPAPFDAHATPAPLQGAH
ncbi:MAG: DinB family protein [Thermoanaerobaculia bacterium]